MASQQELQEVVLRKNTEVSVFRGKPASPQHIGVSIKKLQVCFPAMNSDFFSVLAEYIVKDKITSERLTYMIDNVMRNYKYKSLTIADVIGIDKRVKLYTYSELSEMVTEGSARFEDYPIVEVNGEKFRISIKDKIKYNIK